MNIQQYIKKCDDAFCARLFEVADAICEADVRLVCLSGPTCSGKTTAANMLARRFLQRGRRACIVSIDDFYYDREYLHDLSASKGLLRIDYDSVDTIDLSALREFVGEALGSGCARCPTFDFKSGRRTGWREMQTRKEDIFVFEGIQAIYPEIRALLEPYGAVSVYISPLSNITEGEQVFVPTEIRLMRRLVRDSNFRGADAEFTLHMWESVRANEDAHIFPYADGCVYKIDSTQNYEIGVLKPFLESILSGMPTDAPHHRCAVEILKKVVDVPPIDASLIGEDSIYREFV